MIDSATMNDYSPVTFAIIGFLLLSYNAEPTALRHVTEIKCKSELDDHHHCKQVDKPGADLAIKINAATQKVQITIERNDGNWSVHDLILTECDVVDYDNWRCPQKVMDNIVETHGMSDGQYYYSITGGYTSNYYHSGLTGLRYWLYSWLGGDFRAAVKWQQQGFFS